MRYYSDYWIDFQELYLPPSVLVLILHLVLHRNPIHEVNYLRSRVHRISELSAMLCDLFFVFSSLSSSVS
jgi:hypothetical protein